MTERAPRLVLPLHLWLLATHLTVLLLPLAALLGTGALGLDLRQQTAEDIAHQASLVALHCEHLLASGQPLPELSVELSALLHQAKGRTLAGFRVVDQDGLVIASSAFERGQDLGAEPTVQIALAGSTAAWEEARGPTRRGLPLAGPSRHADVRLFVAEPISDAAGQVVGAVVVSRTPREEFQALFQMAPALWAGAALALAITVLLATSAGFLLSRSLRALATASLSLAHGDLDAVTRLAGAHRSRVAEARELAHAMASMAARLQARLRYITEFAGHVSHEFKTPVSALKGTIELLRDDEEMPPAQRARFLDNALQDLDRLSRLVGGLLRLARAEEGGDRRVVDLQRLLQQAARRWPGVHLAPGERQALVEGNEEQLLAAVDNLVDNARRYGGAEAKREVRLLLDGGWVRVEVEDDGPGISQENLGRVFERFFTTGRDRGGTGLGLALVAAIVQAHRGQVGVESRPGRTVFRLDLPRLSPGGPGTADRSAGAAEDGIPRR